MKLNGLESTSRLLWCCGSSGSGLSDGSGSCRRWAAGAAGVRRGATLGKGKMPWKRSAGMSEQDH
jgi:hypothetical protein